jgi:thiaminase/transcriptional activator TenA
VLPVWVLPISGPSSSQESPPVESTCGQIEMLDSARLVPERYPCRSNELSLHRAYAAEFGINCEELAQESSAPATRAYTDFLLRVATTGDFVELVAALLPCMWGFSEIGQQLATQPAPSEKRYARWIAMYSSREFAELAAWCRDLLDSLAAGLPERDLKKLEAAFFTSSRYEWQFWEMAWKMERWQV